MDTAITYRTATVEDALTICELGQLLNAIHHAARPDIYTAATQDFSRDLPHWMSFSRNRPRLFSLRISATRPLASFPPACRQAPVR